MVAPWKTIDEARVRAGITQKEMAARVGVSQTAVQKWKNGGKIAYETLVQLSVVLHTTAAELLGQPRAASVLIGAPPGSRVTANLASGQNPGTQLCRFPSDCDLSARLASMEAENAQTNSRLASMETQLQTLIGLLGASLRKPGEVPDVQRRAKAG